MECNLNRQLFKSAKSRIVFSVLNTVLQVALQVCLIPVTRKVYEDLADASCFQLDALGWFDSLVDNILLISLHLLALALHIISARKNNTLSFAPLLLILFGLSLGSSVAQLARIINLQCKACDGICSTSSTAGMVVTTTLRFCLSLTFLTVLMAWMTPWRSSFIKDFAWKTYISILAYLVGGAVLLAYKQFHDSAVFWVWVTFTATLLLVTSIGMALSRRALRKNTPPMTSAAESPKEDSHADIDIRVGASSQTLPSTTYVSVGQSSSTSGPLEGPIAHFQIGAAISSESKLEIRSSVLTAYANSKLSTEASSARSSIGVETLHTAVYSRSSMSSSSLSVAARSQSPDREQTSIRVRDSARRTTLYTDSSPRASVAEEEPQPSRSSDSEQFSREGTPSHRFSGSSSSTVNVYSPATWDGEDLQSQSSGEPEPAETEGMIMTPFPSSSSPTAPPTPSEPSSTPTVPSYTEGPYAYRRRHDTLASYGTYETLPSYHSRRSSQTLAELMNFGPPTPRHVRSLPPLPPLPPFAMLSASIFSTPNPSSAEISTTDDDLARTVDVSNR
ncbi:hypothetical protein E1B28_006690 [Marasmius oreades]|uniref:Uncharacterized protein n=1 Tax=Marasmius oreades TaxID=181124 RepID=A0A9P7UWN0_9AGAR|nr:uncharacterized protein E1B28_006690 [Marasmius oreades]KAG7096008.1 hypothetical protein E1B28_006690 [Marasmius oreades]